MNKFARVAISICASAALLGCAVQREQQSVGTYVDDVTITASVKAKFASAENVSMTAIKVETMRGVVQLSGFAKSDAEKDAAVDIARTTRNVLKVIDSIVIQP